MNKDLSVIKFDYLVSALDTNPNGIARITSLLDFCQNTAWRHYHYVESVIGKILDDNQGWLLSKLIIDIDEYPDWGSTVFVETWAPGLERVTAFRNFLIKDKNDKIYAKAFTTWVVVDINRGRLVRLDAFNERWPFGPEKVVVEGGVSKINSYDDILYSKIFKAKYSDIDVNKHVNNVKYIEWIIDNYDYNFLENHYVKKLEVNFISETVCGDEVAVGLKALSTNKQFFNNVVRVNDNKEICRVLIDWV